MPVSLPSGPLPCKSTHLACSSNPKTGVENCILSPAGRSDAKSVPGTSLQNNILPMPGCGAVVSSTEGSNVASRVDLKSASHVDSRSASRVDSRSASRIDSRSASRPGCRPTSPADLSSSSHIEWRRSSHVGSAVESTTTCRPSTASSQQADMAGCTLLSTSNRRAINNRQFPSDHDEFKGQNSCYKAEHVRPASASPSAVRTQQYVMQRLHQMCRQRRASSATSRVSYIVQPEVIMRDMATNDDRTATIPPVHNDIHSLKSALDKFRQTVRLVISLRCLMAVMTNDCRAKTLRSANEHQWMTIYAEKHDVTLAFNKHLYSKDRVSTHVPDWAVSVLQQRPEERTDQDCQLLHALLRGMRNFDMFTSEIQMALCRAFTLERVAEGRVVLKSGHVGSSFYLIYSGSVFVNVEDSSWDGRNFARTVAVLTRGQSFGELALLQDIRRTATVSVRERCEFLTVDKNIFASVCPQIFERELVEKYSFLCSLDLFSAKYWSSESVRFLAMHAQIQEYKTNKVIVSNSMTEDWIYICMEGRCQIVQCLPLDQPVPDGHGSRRTSQVVLSEEILQLLSSTGQNQGHGQIQQNDDMREFLLYSLGLDYLQTGKTLIQGFDHTKTTLNMNETMTLTTFVSRYLEDNDKEFVILSLGVLEPSQVFDLPSLLDEESCTEAASALMLVSNGAKIIKIRKAAFFDQLSQQALDNTRTLASKLRKPSSTAILESFKCEVTWEAFKSSLVSNILKHKQSRGQPLYRASSAPPNRPVHTPVCYSNSFSATKRSKIISALHRNRAQETKPAVSSSSSFEEFSHLDEKEDTDPVNQSTRSTGGKDYLETIRSDGQNDVVIIRRQLSSSKNKARVARRQTTSVPLTHKSQPRPMSAM